MSGDEEMLWELVASEVSLGRYDLVVEAYLRPEGTEAEVVGVWSEPLNQRPWPNWAGWLAQRDNCGKPLKYD